MKTTNFPIYNIIYKGQPKYRQVDLATAITAFRTKEEFRCFQFNHVREYGSVKYTLTRMVHFKLCHINHKHLVPAVTHWQ